jgi:hypothetical protein
MLHGDEDDTVPAAHSKAYESLGGVDTTVTIVEGINHMDVIKPCGDSWQGLVTALERFRT